MSDIEGKAAMVAASECGQRASFNYEVETREAGKSLFFDYVRIIIENSISFDLDRWLSRGVRSLSQACLQ